MKRVKYFFLCFILTACDFSSHTNKGILEAQQYLKNLEYEKAAKKYEEILEKLPKSTLKNKILFQLGEVHSLYLNNQKEAIKSYIEILESSDDPRWKINAQEKLAEIYFTLYRNYSQSKQYYLELYNFYPYLEKRDLYQMRLGESFLKLNNLKEAEEVFLDIMKNKNHEFRVRSFFFLGLIKFNSKDWNKATDFWLEYLRRETVKDHIIHTKFLLANAYETMEELKKAYDIYYSLLGEYPNPKVIESRLKALYTRRIARNR